MVKPWCDGPAPPVEQYGTLRSLRRATLAYAEDFYRWRWGRLSDGDRARLNSEEDRAAYEATRPHEERARRILERVRGALDSASGFVAEYDGGTGGLYAEELVAIVEAVRSRDTAVTHHPAMRPSRTTWLRERALDPYTPKRGRLSDHELAVLAVIGGWWPARITTERVSVAPVSVAHVMNEERKNQRSARKSLAKLRNTRT